MNLIIPNWPAPQQIKACTTTRQGGISQAPFDTLNLASHVTDSLLAVENNRKNLYRDLGCSPVIWLNQTHSTHVINADQPSVLLTADAIYSKKKNTVCAVLTADCLPILICNRQGSCVAAVHAGWKGLAGGVIEKTIRVLDTPIKDLLVWLGPTISQAAFTVGKDVYIAFTQQTALHNDNAFKVVDSEHWLADLILLAKQRLLALGIQSIYSSDLCTYKNTDRFFSFRRDKITGRMASLIWIA